MSEGWISLHRKLQNNPIWSSETFTRGQAWVDLLLLANHKDGYLRIDGKRIDVKRGQLGWSILNISKRWKWSRGKTTRFLKELETDGQITLKTDTKNSIITLCKYNEYQSASTPRSTTHGTTDEHHVVQQTDTNNNVNNKNNVNNVNKQKVTLEELSTSHVSQWLAKKRLLGKYVNHNESDILETFKNYCESKGKKYENFIAAYRNSFEWERNQPKANTITPKLSKHQRARIALGLDSAEPQPSKQIDVTPADLL